MAEVWGIALGTVAAAGIGAASARSAARAGERSANAANSEQARQYDQTRQDWRQQRELGQGATSMLGRLYGIPIQSEAAARANEGALVGDRMLPSNVEFWKDGVNYGNSTGGRNTSFEVRLNGQRIGDLTPGGASGRFTPAPGVDVNALQNSVGNGPGASAGGATTGPDMSVFFESPDYQFNLAEGQKAIDRSLAARGRSLSGAGVREGVRYASGMASNEYGNFYNRLANLAGLGQAATQATTQAGMNAANNISQNHLFAGQAGANGYMQTGAAVNNAIQGGIGNYMLARYLQQPGGGVGTPPYAGGGSDPYGYYRGGGIGMS